MNSTAVDTSLPIPQGSPPPASSPVLTAGGVVLAIVGLYFGRDIFVPFAVAVLLSFALAPLIEWLRRRGLPRIAAVLLAVALAFTVLGGIGVVVGSQFVQLADNLPTYQQTITHKIRALRSSTSGNGLVEKITQTLEGVSQELAAAEGLLGK